MTWKDIYKCTTRIFDICWIDGVYVVLRRPHDTIGAKNSRMGCKTTATQKISLLIKLSVYGDVIIASEGLQKFSLIIGRNPRSYFFYLPLVAPPDILLNAFKFITLSDLSSTNDIHRHVHWLVCSWKILDSRVSSRTRPYDSTVHLYEALQLVQHQLVSFSRIIWQYYESG